MLGLHHMHRSQAPTLISLSNSRVRWMISSVDILSTSSPMPSCCLNKGRNTYLLLLRAAVPQSPQLPHSLLLTAGWRSRVVCPGPKLGAQSEADLGLPATCFPALQECHALWPKLRDAPPSPGTHLRFIPHGRHLLLPSHWTLGRRQQIHFLHEEAETGSAPEPLWEPSAAFLNALSPPVANFTRDSRLDRISCVSRAERICRSDSTNQSQHKARPVARRLLPFVPER